MELEYRYGASTLKLLIAMLQAELWNLKRWKRKLEAVKLSHFR